MRFRWNDHAACALTRDSTLWGRLSFAGRIPRRRDANGFERIVASGKSNHRISFLAMIALTVVREGRHVGGEGHRDLLYNCHSPSLVPLTPFKFGVEFVEAARRSLFPAERGVHLVDVGGRQGDDWRAAEETLDALYFYFVAPDRQR